MSEQKTQYDWKSAANDMINRIEQTGDGSYRTCAASHTTRVLDIHYRKNGSIVLSSELDSQDGHVVRHLQSMQPMSSFREQVALLPV